MMNDMKHLQQRIKTWADKRMPERDIPGRLRKLGEEHGEFGEAVTRYMMSPTADNAIAAGIEAADMAMILTDSLDMMGLSLLKCMQLKMQIIEARPIEEFVEFKG
jgi:hypothetical protein